MRCRLRVAEPFTGEKVTLFSVTRCRATPHHRLRAELPLKGEAKEESCRAARRTNTSCPEYGKLSPLCTLPLSAVAPGLPVPRGVSGGGAALSPGFSLHLCSPEQHGAHFAAQSPERSFFFPLFLSAEKEKEVISGDAVVKSLSGFVSATEIDRLRQIYV